jgi:hypothetical protein
MRKYLLCTCAVALTMLTWGTGVGLASVRGTEAAHFYEDESSNVCVGLEAAKGFGKNCLWGELKTQTFADDTALGEFVLPKDETGSEDVAIGNQALEHTTTGSQDTAVGEKALSEDETASDNTATGYLALLHDGLGGSNTATGVSADYRCGWSGGSECKENTEVGASALRNNEKGSANAAFGFDALAWPEGVSGSEDVGLGYKAGSATKGGAHNVDIANEGVSGDERTTRIGTENEKARAFMAGIYRRAIEAPSCGVIVNSVGQLGCEDTKGDASPTVAATMATDKAEIGRQQHEIAQMKDELQSLRQEIQAHR